MLNVPTTRATPAKIRRKIRRTPRNPALMSSMFSWVRRAPVMAWVPGGIAACTRPASVACDTPGRAVATIRVMEAGFLVMWRAAPGRGEGGEGVLPQRPAGPEGGGPPPGARAGPRPRTVGAAPALTVAPLAAPRL